ncbi:MAG: geranylgeranylglyceryl/heptaprenylglyceryl phosphate synthase [Candidatus Nanohaloarchaea archaeon]
MDITGRVLNAVPRYAGEDAFVQVAGYLVDNEYDTIADAHVVGQLDPENRYTDEELEAAARHADVISLAGTDGVTPDDFTELYAGLERANDAGTPVAVEPGGRDQIGENVLSIIEPADLMLNPRVVNTDDVAYIQDDHRHGYSLLNNRYSGHFGDLLEMKFGAELDVTEETAEHLFKYGFERSIVPQYFFVANPMSNVALKTGAITELLEDGEEDVEELAEIVGVEQAADLTAADLEGHRAAVGDRIRDVEAVRDDLKNYYEAMMSHGVNEAIFYLEGSGAWLPDEIRQTAGDTIDMYRREGRIPRIAEWMPGLSGGERSLRVWYGGGVGGDTMIPGWEDAYDQDPADMTAEEQVATVLDDADAVVIGDKLPDIMDEFSGMEETV